VTDRLRIGSRGSALALVQSRWVAERLEGLHPGLEVEIVVIQTKGDKLLDAPLAKLGDKGLFVKEIEEALRDGRVDLAVHSAKDMPTETPAGLEIAAFTAREDVRDVFVAHPRATARRLEGLARGAVVGTSSLRRRSQLLALRPDLEVVDIRGNVETRMRKVEEQDMAGTILAAAGLERLGRAGAAAFAFTFDELLPAVGQGSLALEARAGDERVGALLAPLADAAATLTVRAERALMRALQGGCQVPIAGYGELVTSASADGARDAGRSAAGELRLRAFVGALDGREAVRLETTGPADAPEALGERLAGELLAGGADRILAAVRAQAVGA
jgi:hydroxymethylbilane synthase